MIKTLLGIRLRSAFTSVLNKKSNGSNSRRSAGTLVGIILIYGILAFCMLTLFGTMAIAMAAVMLPASAEWLYFGIFTIIAFAFVFIFSIFETKSELFECRDNELLLSMPISPKHIVISRIAAVLIYNYLEALLVFAPVIVVYLAFGGTPLYAFGAFVAFLCVPLLATALASGIGYLIALITKRVKKNSFVTLAVSLVFFALYFVGYNALMNGMSSLEDPNYDISSLVENAGAIYFVGLSAMLHPLWTTLLAVISFSAAYIAYRLISASYIAIVSDTGSAKRAVYKAKRLKKASSFMALTKKEIKRFTSSANYMLNAGMGIIFTVVLGVAAVIGKSELSMLLSEITAEFPELNGPELMSPVAIALLVFMASLNMMSTSALSLEGKNLWIIKSLPVRSREVLFAKTMPHILISVPPTLVASVCFIIATDAPAVYWPFFILTAVVANILFAFLGMVLNTAMPKFDYENEAQPIKQSLPVFISTMVGMIFGTLVVAVNFILAAIGFSLFATVITFVFNLALAAVFFAVLNTVSVRKYDSLSI